MTEQEAEELVKWLMRVWHPEGGFEIGIEPLGYTFRGRLSPPCVLFAQYLTSRVVFALAYETAQGHRAILSLRTDMSEYRITQGSFHKTLAQELLPLFRRNCWLCGLPIEATAHEKAEWIQGFTREELEAWNLKI